MRERGASLLEDIGGLGREPATFYPADLSSLAEVRRLAAAVQQDHDRLDALVNNAGIGSPPGGLQRRTSADGFELRFAVNYLAGFLLTHQLLPLLMASAPARIVNVASAGQYPIDFDDVMLTRGYDGADRSRFNASWRTPSTSADAEIAAGGRLLRDSGLPRPEPAGPTGSMLRKGTRLTLPSFSR